MRKINLLPPKRRNRRAVYPPDRSTIYWKQAPAFFLNRRGYLIHRVRCVSSHMIDGEHDHFSAHYLCNNFGQGDYGEFFDDPPADRLVCQFCEFVAKSLGLPTADELAGRHVHVGKIRAEQTCCREQREAS